MSTEYNLCPRCGKSKDGPSKFGVCVCISKEQRREVHALRDHLFALLNTEADAFEKEHPDIKITLSLKVDGENKQ